LASRRAVILISACDEHSFAAADEISAAPIALCSNGKGLADQR
jgi:hypothetical protein